MIFYKGGVGGVVNTRWHTRDVTQTWCQHANTTNTWPGRSRADQRHDVGSADYESSAANSLSLHTISTHP